MRFPTVLAEGVAGELEGVSDELVRVGASLVNDREAGAKVAPWQRSTDDGR